MENIANLIPVTITPFLHILDLVHIRVAHSKIRSLTYRDQIMNVIQEVGPN